MVMAAHDRPGGQSRFGSPDRRRNISQPEADAARHNSGAKLKATRWFRDYKRESSVGKRWYLVSKSI
jgi:hypothetical protein